MGLIPTYCRALVMLHQKVHLAGPVLTLGNQDLWSNYDELKNLFTELGCAYVDTVPLPHTSRLFGAQTNTAEFVHAKTFFAMMGINDYYDLDKFDVDAPQILHDLNQPVPSELKNKFNLIVDGGTIEHIFDVRQVMENIVRMCKDSGWIVHITPSSNYMDHGFYCFSPCFFYDLYSANGFGEFTCFILQANPRNFLDRCSYFEYTYGMDFDSLIDPERVPVVFFAAKKLDCREAFVKPNQGDYADSLRRATLESPQPFSDGSALGRSVLPRFLMPLLRPALPWLRGIRSKVNPPYQRLRTL